MSAESRLMRLAASIFAILVGFACPATADSSNVTVAPSGLTGPAGRMVLAQRTYQTAMQQGDAILLLAAIRLAGAVTLRPPTGWSRTTTGEAPDEQPVGRAAAPNPAAPQVLAIVQALAGEDPSLQDLVYDLDAQYPHGRHATAIEATAILGGGQTDTWRIALSGDVPAEFGLIGDRDTVLGLTVTDDTGSVVCALPPAIDPGLCRFTPARNGFFNVTVQNPGTIQNSYRLIGS